MTGLRDQSQQLEKGQYRFQETTEGHEMSI
jgi:hypothetical protein